MDDRQHGTSVDICPTRVGHSIDNLVCVTTGNIKYMRGYCLESADDDDDN
jgi:hypothetical protein